MLDNSTFDYKPHLKSAYIDPIRTVTVIDDEYPTIDDLISSTKDSFSQDNISRLKDIIDISRSEEYNWLLDVYNGKEKKIQEGTVSNRLYHSDLLILDYHLDGEDSGYCKKSIDIIKNLSENRHFNIVAVHTKGYDGQKGSVNEVLIDIITSLQERPAISILNDKIKNPFQKTSLRESRRKKKTLTREQILASRKVLNQFIEREKMQRGYRSPLYPAWFWLTVVETFNYTAIRLNQLIHLRVRDIDLVHDTLFIQSEGSKSHDEHIVPIASRLRPYLEHLLEEAKTKGMRADDQLFNINRFSQRTLRQGKPMTENQVSYFFAKLSDACHSRFSSHRYRHTVATELMQKPEQNLYVTQKLLGHRDIKVTLSYIEHNVEMLRSCVERD
ncbi:tyrosine-type recombinase/integrase [Salmonella enterica]